MKALAKASFALAALNACAAGVWFYFKIASPKALPPAVYLRTWSFGYLLIGTTCFLLLAGMFWIIRQGQIETQRRLAESERRQNMMESLREVGPDNTASLGRPGAGPSSDLAESMPPSAPNSEPGYPARTQEPREPEDVLRDSLVPGVTESDVFSGADDSVVDRTGKVVGAEHLLASTQDAPVPDSDSAHSVDSLLDAKDDSSDDIFEPEDPSSEDEAFSLEDAANALSQSGDADADAAESGRVSALPPGSVAPTNRRMSENSAMILMNAAADALGEEEPGEEGPDGEAAQPEPSPSVENTPVETPIVKQAAESGSHSLPTNLAGFIDNPFALDPEAKGDPASAAKGKIDFGEADIDSLFDGFGGGDAGFELTPIDDLIGDFSPDASNEVIRVTLSGDISSSDDSNDSNDEGASDAEPEASGAESLSARLARLRGELSGDKKPEHNGDKEYKTSLKNNTGSFEIPTRRVPGQDAVPKNPAPLGNKESDPFDTGIGNIAPRELNRLWRNYLDANKKVGRDLARINPEKFRKHLVKNHDAIVKQYSCQSVSFTVCIQDNRVSLQATPVK